MNLYDLTVCNKRKDVQSLILSVVVTVAVTVTVTGSNPAVGMGTIVTRPTRLGVEVEAAPSTGVVCDTTGAGDEGEGAGTAEEGVI